MQAASRAGGRALRDGIPYGGAAVVLALSFGVVARDAGMPAVAAVVMSAVVYAGSAQFAALGILGAGGGRARGRRRRRARRLAASCRWASRSARRCAAAGCAGRVEGQAQRRHVLDAVGARRRDVRPGVPVRALRRAVRLLGPRHGHRRARARARHPRARPRRRLPRLLPRAAARRDRGPAAARRGAGRRGRWRSPSSRSSRPASRSWWPARRRSSACGGRGDRGHGVDADRPVRADVAAHQGPRARPSPATASCPRRPCAWSCCSPRPCSPRSSSRPRWRTAAGSRRRRHRPASPSPACCCCAARTSCSSSARPPGSPRAPAGRAGLTPGGGARTRHETSPGRRSRPASARAGARP